MANNISQMRKDDVDRIDVSGALLDSVELLDPRRIESCRAETTAYSGSALWSFPDVWDSSY